MKKITLLLSLLLIASFVSAQHVTTEGVQTTSADAEITSEVVPVEHIDATTTRSVSTTATRRPAAATGPVEVPAEIPAPVRKVWNNGTIDYIPLGTEIKLEAENWDGENGKILYSLNLGAATEYTQPVPLTEEGQFVLGWGTKDLWGTYGNTKIYTGIVDGTAPVISSLLSGPTYTANGVLYVTKDTSILFKGEDDLAGTEHLYTNLLDANYADVIKTGALSLAELPEGNGSASTYAVDYVGNISHPLITEFVIDNTAPAVEIELDIEPVLINNEQHVSPYAQFYISAADELSGVANVFVSVDGAEFAAFDTTNTLVIEEIGKHSLQVYAVDNLGNVSEITEMNFATDFKLPSAELFLSVSNETDTTQVPVEATEIPADTITEETVPAPIEDNQGQLPVVEGEK